MAKLRIDWKGVAFMEPTLRAKLEQLPRAELDLYTRTIARWDALPSDTVLTEAARLFNLAVLLVGQRRISA